MYYLQFLKAERKEKCNERKNKKVVSVDSDDKTDCFAWRSKVKCDALKTKTCKDCAFYKKKGNR